MTESKSCLVGRTVLQLAANMFAFVLVVCLSAGVAVAKDELEKPYEGNAAQQLLLFKNHMAKIKKPVRLRYRFERKSDKEGDSFEDHIDVNVVEVNADGSKNFSFDFLTGARNKPYDNVNNFRTNPLVMNLIRRDIWEMARDVGGHAQQANYLGKRINYGFRNDPPVENVTIETKTGPIKGKKIRFVPFLKDKHVAKFAKYENKIYEFYFSEEIPGEFYMWRTLVPSGEASKDAGPRVEETATFVDVLPAE